MRSQADWRSYQRASFEFAVETRRCYLAAKAGAGKTAVGLALADYVLRDTFETSKVLVVAPKRVAAQWPAAAKDWAYSSDLRVLGYVGTPDERKAALRAPCDVLCVSFEFFPELVRSTGSDEWPYGLVIFDEASRLRNGGRRGSVTWKAMNAVARKTNARILLMSGSPRPGTAHELFAPVFLLDGGERLGKTLTAFRGEYLEPNKQNRHTGQVYSWRLRDGMESQLYDRIDDLYFGVAPDLGLSKVVVDRWVELPASVTANMAQLMRHQVIEDDDLELTAESQGTVAGKVHQMGQGAVFDDDGRVVHLHDAKLDEVKELLEQIDAPTILAYWYTHDRDRLMQAFPQAVDIGTEKGLKAALAGEVELALLHPGAAGHGIDGLQARFSHMVWFAVTASFELYDQACARIVRSGMLGDTATIYRVLAGPADERIVQRLAEKEEEQERFFAHMEGRLDG